MHNRLQVLVRHSYLYGLGNGLLFGIFMKNDGGYGFGMALASNLGCYDAFMIND
jgi:hypothetical protein